MNSLQSYSITSPFNETDKCSRIVIDDVTIPFTLCGVAAIGQEYTLSFWLKSEAAGSLIACGATFPSTTAWEKHIVTFISNGVDIELLFAAAGTYYLYHPKLETGNKATDWTPAPEDFNNSIAAAQETANQATDSATAANERISTAEALIQMLSNCISMLVIDENGESLMTQTENGWTFSMKETADAVSGLMASVEELQKETGSTQATVDILQQAVNDHGQALEYVNISVYEGEPCIELGESDSNFKLLVTNTRIMFMNGSNIPTYINTNGIVTQNIDVKGEIVQGGYVMLNTSDGGWGLLWKGVSS